MATDTALPVALPAAARATRSQESRMDSLGGGGARSLACSARAHGLNFSLFFFMVLGPIPGDAFFLLR
jgi:hypothetical protein